MITASGEQEKVAAIEAGADDFIAKPFDQAELLARVRSLLRIKRYHDTIEAQAAELAAWNRAARAARRASRSTRARARCGRLRRFLPPQLAELVVVVGRRVVPREPPPEITVVFCDLRGFTAFAETVEPEDLMLVLGEYHAALGDLVHRFEGTLDRFTGDGLMAFFNDPLPCPDAPERAVRMAVAMRNRVATLAEGWRRMGHDLAFAVGVAQGHATLGRIGYEGRFDYTAIGNVTNLAARLCAEAGPGQILISQRVYAAAEELVTAEPVGELDAARLLAPRAGLQRARPRRGAGRRHEPRPSTSDPRLSELSEHERGERFARLQERLVPVWSAMRLNEPGESIVVVPSVAPDRPEVNGAELQAYEERFLFLLLLLRHPRLQVIYVTGAAGRPRASSSTTSRCCRASSRATPARACTSSPPTTARRARWPTSCSSARASSPRSAPSSPTAPAAT